MFMTAYAIVLLIGVVAGVVSGVIGTGASIMLLPPLVFYFGAKQAVPIMAIAAVLGNVSRAYVWRRDIDWTAFFAYSIAAAPAAALGANTLWALNPQWVDCALGVFFLSMIPYRYIARRSTFALTAWQLAAAGVVVGYLTGIVFSTGPLTLPIFSAYGLLKGGLLATEAAASLAVYASKLVAFGQLGGLPLDVAIKGALVGLSLSAGISVGKAVTLRLSTNAFQRLLDLVMLSAGTTLLWGAIR
ncbi:sulfite exporter TauE/SafE family protein [Burkholderia pseudomallei]|nr:sulfite exporter TauE/SafE family protein [Burkholderia pseudomallei]